MSVRVEMVVYGYLSRHHDEQQDVDAALWSEFCERVKAITKERRYESIDLDVL